MSKKNSYYLPLPEDFLDRPKTQMLIAKYGLGAVTVYHDLQTRMRDYENETETSFMIPMEHISFLCFRYHMTKEELQNLVNYFYGINLLKFYEIEDEEGNKARYFYSEEIMENHKAWVERRSYMTELGIRSGVRRRLNKKKQHEEEDNNEQDEIKQHP